MEADIDPPKILSKRADTQDYDTPKLELSILPPAEQTKLEAQVRKSALAYKEKFGQFIPNETLDRLINNDSPNRIDHRVVVTDDLGLWSEEYGDFSEPPAGEYDHEVQYILITNPEPAWNRYMTSQRAERLIELYGSTQNGHTAFEISFVTEIIAHELAHALQKKSKNDSKLMWFFYEMGAQHFELAVIKAQGIEPILANGQQKRPKLYEEWFNKYGEDLHRLFFGTPLEDPSLEGKIKLDVLKGMMKSQIDKERRDIAEDPVSYFAHIPKRAAASIESFLRP